MSPTVEWIAHRGSSYLAPENTMAAFRLGWEETTTCELDIHANRDGRLVVIHDDSTLRTTGVDLRVSASTWNELRQLDAGAFKGERWRGEGIPLLEDVLAAMPERNRLLIEIKAGIEIVPGLARLLAASGKTNRIRLQCFDPEVCDRAKQTIPGALVSLLVASNRDTATGTWLPTMDTMIDQAKRLKLDGLGLNDMPLIDANSVAKIHDAGLRVAIWTIDDPEAACRLISFGVDDIITNRPAWLRDVTKQK